jgi:hypothetical protein
MRGARIVLCGDAVLLAAVPAAGGQTLSNLPPPRVVPMAPRVVGLSERVDGLTPGVISVAPTQTAPNTYKVTTWSLTVRLRAPPGAAAYSNSLLHSQRDENLRRPDRDARVRQEPEPSGAGGGK